MGRFSCLVFVLASACADQTVGVPDDTDGTVVPEGVDSVVAAPRYAPSVCGAGEWATKVTDAKVDLSVAPRANGAAIVSMPIAGGDAHGIVVDGRLRMVQDQTVATGYDMVNVSHAANRIASTAAANGSIDLSLWTDDLKTSQLVTSIAGNVVAKPAFHAVDHNLVMAVGGDNGLSIYRFADSFEPIDSRLVVATNPVESVTAAQFGTKTLAAWSTAKQCYVAEINGLESGNVSSSALPCHNPRLAVDPSTSIGILVYDTPAGATLQVTQGAKLFTTKTFAGMTAPRVMFDGKRFWISYLDVRGDVLVGFLDEKFHPVTLGINFTRPFQSAYELAMVEGSPWVFSLDANGYAAHRLCTVKY